MSTVRLSAQDALWLTMDRPNNLMVVDVVVVLGGEPGFEAVTGKFDEMVKRFPVLARRPVRRGRAWTWSKDRDFQLSRHLFNVTYDEPISMPQLQAFVGEQRSVPLDKERPLWTAFLVGPVTMADGRTGSALVTRFHHAIADGVRLTQVLLGMCEAVDGTMVPLVSRKGVQGDGLNPIRAVADTATGLTRLSVGAMQSTWSFVGDGAAAARRVTSPDRLASAVGSVPGVVAGRLAEGIAVVRSPDHLLNAFEDAGGPAHRSLNDVGAVTKLALGGSDATIWTGEPGVDKCVSWSPPMSLADVKAAARRQQATVNDILVAAVAGGLRRYLADHRAAASDVTWMVPVNLKPFEEAIPEELGNHFALVMLVMPLGEESRSSRLAEIHRRMQRIKNSDEALITFGVQRTLAVSPHVVAESITNFFANKALGVLTNVPGPTGRIAFAGAEVVQVMGFAPCSGNQPLTATIFTYDGQVTIGFAADATLAPNLPTLVGHVVAEVGELVSA